MKKLLKNPNLFLVSSILLAFILTSCGSNGLKPYKSSAEDFGAIKTARIIYLGRNYEKARGLFKDLLDRGVRTGDVHYYYAFALDFPGATVTNLENGEEVVRIPNFKEITDNYATAVKWLNEYKSEFPEDKNRDKAMYNLGVMFYRDTVDMDLKKVKEVWDLGLRINPGNTYIKKEYPNLKPKLEYTEARETVASFLTALGEAKTAAEVDQVGSDYRSKVTQLDFSKFKKWVKNLDEVTRVVTDFDKFIDTRKSELSRR